METKESYFLSMVRNVHERSKTEGEMYAVFNTIAKEIAGIKYQLDILRDRLDDAEENTDIEE